MALICKWIACGKQSYKMEDGIEHAQAIIMLARTVIFF